MCMEGGFTSFFPFKWKSSNGLGRNHRFTIGVETICTLVVGEGAVASAPKALPAPDGPPEARDPPVS